jgi:hypothetical protein
MLTLLIKQIQQYAEHIAVHFFLHVQMRCRSRVVDAGGVCAPCAIRNYEQYVIPDESAGRDPESILTLS